MIVPEFYAGKRFGRFHGMSSEYDAMMSYLLPLCESLEDDNVRYDIHQEGDIVNPNSIVIHASIGWFKEKDKPIKSNKSYIRHGKNSSALADVFYETIVDWGKTYIDFEHTGNDPREDKANEYLCHSDTIAVSIAPFMINHVKSDEYLRWAPMLGKMLSAVLIDFVRSHRDIPVSPNYFGRASG